MVDTTSSCKICGASNLRFFAHTATCKDCKVLLCYPYPASDDKLNRSGMGREENRDVTQIQNETLKWHLRSGKLNHNNFTNIALFALNDADRYREIKILDYGGGGGQFALVITSLYILSQVYIVDINDNKLLEKFSPLNHQIKFDDFMKDDNKFDMIFMNDVFEHVSNPLEVLKTLRGKLTDRESRIFIDTPCQFWIYPVTRLINKELHAKVLRGTVDYDHQQIWSKASFSFVVKEANLTIVKYFKTSEFTQEADFYLDNMKIKNPLVRLIGKLFYHVAPLVAKNKIKAVLKPI